jgi:hypothetical protein
MSINYQLIKYANTCKKFLFEGLQGYLVNSQKLAQKEKMNMI